MNGMDKKTELPVHMIFRKSDHIKIKIQEMSRVRQLGVKVNDFEWVASPGKEADIIKLICTKTSIIDSENFCR